MHEDLLQVRNNIVCFYVLRDNNALYLIDTGFIGGVYCLDQALTEKGWDDIPIRGIILTHGHIDHTLNVVELASRHNAWVAAPRLDLKHYHGKPKYSGISKTTGILEHFARKALKYRAFTPDKLLDDNDELSIWHGLRAVHLPGHTRGHTGYLCEKLGILFSADLFASYSKLSHRPPHFFNDNSTEVSRSIEKALQIPNIGLLPNHCDTATPEEHFLRLKKTAQK